MYRRLLLASVSLVAVSAAAQGADFYWTGAQDNLWSNHNNWGSATAPGAADTAHLYDEIGTSGTPESVQIEQGQATVGTLTVDADYYVLTDDGHNVMLNHELIVTDGFSVADGKQLVIAGTATLTAKGDVSFVDNGYALDVIDYARFSLDGAKLDGGFIRLNDQTKLEVFQTGATAGGITGGTQEFYDSSMLEADESDSITGGYQLFYDLSYLYANAGAAVSGGQQEFHDLTQLRATAANAVAGGYQIFSGSSELRPEVTGAVGDTTIELRDDAKIMSSVADGLSDMTDLLFSSYGGGSGGTFLLGGDHQTVGTINSVNGSYAPGNAGLIINGGPFSTTLTVAGSGDSYFGGVMADGTGAAALGLVKEGTGTLTLAGANTYTGNTTVSAGGLVVNGDISSGNMLYVNDGGWLGGSGTVGQTNVVRGVLKPGNSIGTLHFDKNLVMDGDAAYVVDVAGAGAGPTAGHSDLLDVSGDLFLTGAADIALVQHGGVYSAGSVYTIATADSITGAFDGAIGNADISSFLKFQLGQDATSVFLTVVQAKTLGEAAGTPNQEAVAGVADGLPAGNTVRDLLLSLDETDALISLDALSGEVHASLKAGLIEDSRFVREASLGRLDEPAGDGTAVWSEAYGAHGDWESDGNAAATSRDAHGMFAGIDGTVGNFRFGGLVGYGQSGVGVEDRNSSADIATYQAAIYGGTVEGPLKLRGGLAYGASDVSTQRNVEAGEGFVGTINELDEARYGASTAQAFGELGYVLEVGSTVFEPFAGLTYVNASTDGFSESGALTGLTAEAQSIEQTYASLGIRAKGQFALGDLSAELHGSLAWRHAFEDGAPAATLALEGEEFTVGGVPAGADAALVEAGLDLGLSDNATLGFSYSGVLTETSADQSMKGVLSVKF